jgi:hypothetical protein
MTRQVAWPHCEQHRERQTALKLTPSLADRVVMDYNMLSARFRQWRNELKRIPAMIHSGPSPASSPEWFTGLAVSPASFSRQLSEMQLSLLRANMSPPEETGAGALQDRHLEVARNGLNADASSAQSA